jgi:hypothetical protein
MTAHAGFQVLGTVREVRITERGARKFKVAEVLLDLNQDESLVVEATHERLGAAQRLEPGDVVMVCPHCGAKVMLCGSGTTFMCDTWVSKDGTVDQSRECTSRQRDQLRARVEEWKTADCEWQTCWMSWVGIRGRKTSSGNAWKPNPNRRDCDE